MNPYSGLQPQIIEQDEKRLAGKQLQMSLLDDQTGVLWKSSMPLLRTVTNRSDDYRVSLQVYPPGYFQQFNPARPFTKWAGVLVKEGDLPEGLEEMQIPAGLYALFLYKGLAGDPSIFQYIFTSWIPTSGYELDDRPHFEKLGPKYRNNDPLSEEEIWIPVRHRNEY